VTTGPLTESSTTVQTAGQYTAGSAPEHVITADFNGDGIADLAVSNFGNLDTNAGGNVMIFLGKGPRRPPVTMARFPVRLMPSIISKAVEGKVKGVVIGGIKVPSEYVLRWL
jgi:hypothetical protein